MEYNSESTLSQILGHEKGKVILEKFNVPCLFCPMAQVEMNELTIGTICQRYDLDLKTLLKELNDQ